MKSNVLITGLAFIFISMSLGKKDKLEIVEIGEQIWMKKNLDVKTFSNGDEIFEAKSEEEWKKAIDEGTPAWCSYNNLDSLSEIYGIIYNWHAVNDPRGLAPKGWRIPTEKDWAALIDKIGVDEAWGKMIDPSGWMKGIKANNESGFSVLPGGHRSYNGKFSGKKESMYFWSFGNGQSIKSSKIKVIWIGLSSYPNVNFMYGEEKTGLYVRCIKDK